MNKPEHRLLIDQLCQRRSVRSFLPDPIPDETKNMILQAMRRAPTAGNQTLYSVIQVADQTKKQELAESCDHQPFIAEAPWVLVFLADVQRMNDFFEASGTADLVARGIARPASPAEGDLLLACCDALIAAQTAVIAAESLGIGTCYIGDILENYEHVRDLLSLPRYTLPITLITFGYPTEQQKKRPMTGRMPLDKFVFTDEYRRIDPSELPDLYAYNEVRVQREAGNPRYLPGAENLGQHTYLRKFSSDFMREMRRSVKKMLEYWK